VEDCIISYAIEHGLSGQVVVNDRKEDLPEGVTLTAIENYLEGVTIGPRRSSERTAIKKWLGANTRNFKTNILNGEKHKIPNTPDINQSHSL